MTSAACSSVNMKESGSGMPERKGIRLSAGTARVLGLSMAKVDDLPTTAYLLTAEKCVHSCQFCPQGRASGSRADLLSRVTWPEMDKTTAAEALFAAPEGVRRVCLQVTDHHGWKEEVEWLAGTAARGRRLPACVSCRPRNLGEVAEILAMGVDKVGIAIDAVTPEIYARVKGDPAGGKTTSWHSTLALILAAARAFPGRVATHVIIGLGETEQDAVQVMRLFADYGVIVGLFAFTPVRGTPLEHAEPPELGQYRRMQAVRYLLAKEGGATESGRDAGAGRDADRDAVTDLVDFRRFRFDGDGRLTDLGLEGDELADLARLLASGDAFRTSGCPDCNRPYYNERPGGVIYNYPRPLTTDETRAALAQTGLFDEGRLGRTAAKAVTG